MTFQTKYILDSGDPDEYREIAMLATQHDQELWGGTTNPTLIAKKLAGKKFTKNEAFNLQKQIILKLTTIVPGAVSAEVYADHETTADVMIEQGREIATWHERVVVKLPTTIAGFIARTALRKDKILTNNTLVFSQKQILAICLHEQLIQNTFGPIQNSWPPFISPFVGRLDDIGIDGMQLVENGMKIKQLVESPTWMLEASVRSIDHMVRGIKAGTELITAPAKTYREWFSLPVDKQDEPPVSLPILQPIPYWQPPEDLLTISSVETFMQALETKKLDITHELTDKGITRFAEDWKAILSE